MQRTIFHIDMNSYFASVEQQANPFLRGRAVGVCAYLSPGGCIIASSKEAKAKGIKTGCRVRDALALDPDVVLLENEPAKYRSTTEAIFGILKEYTGTVEPYSIDEAFLDLTGYTSSVSLRPQSHDAKPHKTSWVSDFDEAKKIGEEIQARIKKEVGEWLGCSIGISWTKFLAKFAGDIAPKKGILLIDNMQVLEEILKDRPLTDAWGINVRTEERLRALGINDLLSLKNYNKDNIRRALGRWGYYLWANVNGVEIDSVNEGSRPPKSVGHSYCLPKHTTDKQYLRPILYKLCEKTGRRLRSGEMEASSLSSGFSYTSAGGAFRSWRTKEKMFTTEEIFREAVKVLDRTDLTMPVRILAVSVGTLTPVSGQMSLFEDKLGQKDLSRALDKINDKYGEYTVVRGSMFGTNDMARDRIGFRKSVSINN